MSHLDDELLAALAASDSPDTRHHTASLIEALENAQSADAVTIESPPESVWQGIRSEAFLSDDDADEADEAGARSSVATLTAERQTRSAQRRSSSAQAPSARARRTWAAPGMMAAAAVAGVLAGVGGTLVVTQSGASAGTTVASAPLADLTTDGSAGEAMVEVRDDGTRVLVVSTDYQPVDDAYLEVWLIDTDVDGMISLGHLTDDSGEFVIPDGFDFTAYPIVDISVEPNDGVPTHSGVSITRGILDV